MPIYDWREFCSRYLGIDSSSNQSVFGRQRDGFYTVCQARKMYLTDHAVLLAAAMRT